MSKSLITSKTFWWNFITIVLAVLALPETAAVIPIEWIKYIALINSLGNVVLRYITSKPINSIL